MSDLVAMAIWAATLPLMPYALWRKKENLFYGSFMAFLMLSFDVLIAISRQKTMW